MLNFHHMESGSAVSDIFSPHRVLPYTAHTAASLRERRPAVPEEHVIDIWLRELHPERRFTAWGGEEVRVLEAGRRNRHDGPDFLDAVVVIDGVLRRGSIEVHVREGDWRRHRHHLNARYDDVVLHVCLYAESGDRRDPPLVVLATQMQEPLRKAWARVRQPRSPLRCRSGFARPDPHHADAMIMLAAAERFERKCTRLEARWKRLAEEMSVAEAFRQTVYEVLARAVGYGGNEDAFERLARALPLRVLAAVRFADRYPLLSRAAAGESPSSTDEHARTPGAQVPSAGDGSPSAGDGSPSAAGAACTAEAQAPALHPHDWNVSGVLPGNRPRRRMRWLADWAPQLNRPSWWRALFAAFDAGVADPESFAHLFSSRVRTGRPGPERMYELAVNVLAPCVRIYARSKGLDLLAGAAASLFFDLAPSPENRYTRVVTRTLELSCDRAGSQQGMIELYTEFCTQSRCGDCLLGIRNRA